MTAAIRATQKHERRRRFNEFAETLSDMPAYLLAYAVVTVRAPA